MTRPHPAGGERHARMFRIDEGLREFCESGVSVLVGTVDATGFPRVAYAWGPRVHPGGERLSVYLERARSGPILSGRATNPQVALTLTDPVSIRSVQLKGRILDVAEPNEAELAWVARHRDAFTVTTSLVGDPPHMIRNLWMDDVIRLDCTAERGFDQTPGPGAGKPLNVEVA